MAPVLRAAPVEKEARESTDCSSQKSTSAELEENRFVARCWIQI